ncbi:MAG: SNF2 helicase-associated domain-containing protein, partial [Gemmatimonadetes bacterium]|nr:SNF2 helicase-associated domain-containing protein [Gemmatimonadota bacterium]
MPRSWRLPSGLTSVASRREMSATSRRSACMMAVRWSWWSIRRIRTDPDPSVKLLALLVARPTRRKASGGVILSGTRVPESVHRAGVGVMLDGGRGVYHCKGDVFDPSPVPCLMEYTSSVTRQAAATVDESARFAFLATYTSRLSVHGKAQHLPLGEALREYAGAGNRERLLSLLLPVQRVAGRCEWLRQMVDSREIFHPLRWTVGEAHRFLQDVPELERAGVIVRMPSNWRATRPPRPQVTATLGTQPPAGIGADVMLDFRMEVTLDGERLSEAEVQQLVAGTRGLELIRGRWVEVDPERLRQ